MLAGSLKDFSIDDIFQLFSLTKKSGALRIEASGTEGHVYFANGAVIFAVADVRRVALGARLVAADLLTEDQLRELASSADGSALELASALLSSSVVEAAGVESYLQEQVHESVGQLLRLADGSFKFDNSTTTSDWPGQSFPAAELLAEGHRRLEEWHTISSQVPSLDVPIFLVPTLPGDVDDVTVARDQWQLLSLIDGRRTARDLVELTGKGEFAACKLLAELLALGLVELARPGGRTALEELVAGREGLRSLDDVSPVPPVMSDVSEPAAPPSELAVAPAELAAAPAELAAPPAEPAAPPAEPAAQLTEPAAPPAELDVLPAEPEDRPQADEAAQDERVDSGQEHDESHTDADAGDPPGDDFKAGHDDPLADSPRRDVNVDRVQMARELASLGFGDAAPLRRAPAKPNIGPGRVSAEAGQPVQAFAARNQAVPAERPAAPAEGDKRESDTIVEHKMARDSKVNRSMLLRLIDGVRGV